MSFDTSKKYLIISGGNLNSNDNFALTCVPTIKKHSEMKFSVNMSDAVHDERCHFSFENNNNQEKSDYFKYFIKSSSNNNLFLGYGPDIKMSGLDINTKVILNSGDDENYKYSFNIQQKDFCNYTIQGLYYDAQYKIIKTYNFSSFGGTTKGAPFVLSNDVSIETIKFQNNFLFKIIPLDVSLCYNEYNLANNYNEDKFIILPGTSLTEYKALTCVSGIKDKSEIKALTPYENAIDNPNCHFTITKSKGDYYHISIKDKNNTNFLLNSNGPDIHKGTIVFGSDSYKVILSSGGGYEHEYQFKISPMSCFYKMYGLTLEGSDKVPAENRLSTYNGTGSEDPLVMSIGADDYTSDGKNNFLFRIIKVQTVQNTGCTYPYPPIDNFILPGCSDKNKLRLQNEGYVLTNDGTFQFFENVNEHSCITFKFISSGIFNIINGDNIKLSLLMNTARQKFVKFADKKEMLIVKDQDKLQQFTLTYLSGEPVQEVLQQNKDLVISNVPTPCIPDIYYLKNENGELTIQKTDKPGKEHTFKVTNGEIKAKQTESFKVEKFASDKNNQGLILILIFCLSLIISILVFIYLKNRHTR
jgi:hypothetical protein